MVALKDTIQQRLDKIKYTYNLLFHVERIKTSENGLDEAKIYKNKAQLHKKLGAVKFKGFAKKLDKAKFKFIKKVIKEDRVIRWSDKLTEYTTEKKLKVAKTEEEKKQLIENMKRGKVLLKKQLKEERSINYFAGVDRRVENFHQYINKNKKIHQNALKLNGALLSASIGLGIAGIPVVPLLLGGYQVLAGFKNIQCINAQEYYLSIMNKQKKSMVRRNLQKVKSTYEENPDLIAGIQKGLQEGKDLYTEDGILDSINTVEGLEQLKRVLMTTRKEQAEIMPTSKVEIPEETNAILEKMIIPPENKQESKSAKHI